MELTIKRTGLFIKRSCFDVIGVFCFSNDADYFNCRIKKAGFCMGTRVNRLGRVKPRVRGRAGAFKPRVRGRAGGRWVVILGSAKPRVRERAGADGWLFWAVLSHA